MKDTLAGALTHPVAAHPQSLTAELQSGLAHLVYGPLGRLVGVLLLILAAGHFLFGRHGRGLLLLLGLFLFFLLPALI